MDLNSGQIILLLLIGLAAGMLSGFVGVGGGIIIVPAMVYFLHMSQLQAQGVSLAVLLMPVGILGVMNYYRDGHINFNYAIIIALGFFVGSYFGSRYALKLPEHKIKFVFGLMLLYVAVRMLWKGGAKWWSEFS
jgi:uncharacterized membrane protein YfcA